MDLTTGLNAISKTLELTKELRAIDSRVDMATLKLKIADLTDSLLDSKQALLDAKQREDELLKEIARLKSLEQFEDHDGLLYRLTDDRQKTGEPYCHKCFVAEEGKLYRLRRKGAYGYEYHCDNCRGGFGTYRAAPKRKSKPSRLDNWLDR